jgi:hypothetical protein
MIAVTLVLMLFMGGSPVGATLESSETTEPAETAIDSLPVIVTRQGTSGLQISCVQVPIAVQVLAGRDDTRSVEGCSSILIAKGPTNAFITLQVEGGGNNLQCQWPPGLQFRCQGTWQYNGPGATATLGVWEPVTATATAIIT